jgi:hypothetical protein
MIYHQIFTTNSVLCKTILNQPIWVLPVTGASVTAGGFTTFQLPVGSVLDLKTVALHFLDKLPQLVVQIYSHPSIVTSYIIRCP